MQKITMDNITMDKITCLSPLNNTLLILIKSLNQFNPNINRILYLKDKFNKKYQKPNLHNSYQKRNKTLQKFTHNISKYTKIC